MYSPPHIVIVNHPGSGASDASLPAIAAALQRQANEHFAAFYNLPCSVAVATPLSVQPKDWVIGLFKDPDQPGALGYHDETTHGLPLAKVFPILDAQDGSALSTTISHELLEMLADPYLTKAVQSSDGKFWAYEVCDAVEQDEYLIDGIKVSNFVTPLYFEPPKSLSGIRLDYLGLVKHPFEVRAGGYMQWHGGGTGGWHQVEHSERGARAYRKRDGGRAHRRRAR